MLTDVFLVRHGDPARDPAVPYQIHPGPDLSDKGREEARQAGLFLADKGVEHFFVSPFNRTTQTIEQIVEQIVEQPDVPVTFTKIVQEQHPDEKLDQVRERMREFIAGAEDSPLSRIALVTHGAPVRAILLNLSNDKIDLSKHSYPGGNPAPTAGIWHAHRGDEGWRFELVFKPT